MQGTLQRSRTRKRFSSPAYQKSREKDKMKFDADGHHQNQQSRLVVITSADVTSVDICCVPHFQATIGYNEATLQTASVSSMPTLVESKGVTNIYLAKV